MIGLKIREFEVLDLDILEDFIKNNNIDIVVLCIFKNGV